MASVDAPGVKTTIKLNASKDYEYVQGLPPGGYRVEQVVFQYQDKNTPQELSAPEGTVTVEPGELTVAPWQAIYLIQDLDRGNRMSVGMRELSGEAAGRLYEELQQDEAFETWRTAS